MREYVHVLFHTGGSPGAAAKVNAALKHVGLVPEPGLTEGEGGVRAAMSKMGWDATGKSELRGALSAQGLTGTWEIKGTFKHGYV